MVIQKRVPFVFAPTFLFFVFISCVLKPQLFRPRPILQPSRLRERASLFCSTRRVGVVDVLVFRRGCYTIDNLFVRVITVIPITTVVAAVSFISVCFLGIPLCITRWVQFTVSSLAVRHFTVCLFCPRIIFVWRYVWVDPLWNHARELWLCSSRPFWCPAFGAECSVTERIARSS